MGSKGNFLRVSKGWLWKDIFHFGSYPLSHVKSNSKSSIGEKSIYRTKKKCKHLTSENTLLKNTHISGGGEQRSKLQPRIPSYASHYNTNPHPINLFKTPLHLVHTYNGNHLSCLQSGGLLGESASSRLD